MTPLASAFVERGHELRWATSSEACARLARGGFETHPAGGPARAIPEVLRDNPEIAALPPGERPELLFAKIFATPNRVSAMLTDVLSVVAQWPPDLIVCDAAEFAAPIAGALLGIPTVTHAFGAMLPEQRVARAGDEVAPVWRANGLEPRPYGGSYDHLYLDIYPAALQPQERPHIHTTQHLRPTSAPTSSGLPVGVPEDLSVPLVYVTLGTVFNTLDVLRTVVDAVQDLPVRLVVTVGPDGDPIALGPRPANVHVASYIPQDQLLPHATAVVSHAGSGTFLASLAAGLPQLCLPQGADQYLNASVCAQAGVGITLPGSASRREVRDALEELLSAPSYVEAARRMSGEFAAMPSPGDVVDRLANDYG
jgi:UDP:flavonoid glycosyltransferase YjiC (YdhE family)